MVIGDIPLGPFKRVYCASRMEVTYLGASMKENLQFSVLLLFTENKYLQFSVKYVFHQGTVKGYVGKGPTFGLPKTGPGESFLTNP